MNPELFRAIRYLFHPRGVEHAWKTGVRGRIRQLLVSISVTAGCGNERYLLQYYPRTTTVGDNDTPFTIREDRKIFSNRIDY